MATALTQRPTPTTLAERITAIEQTAGECALDRLGNLGSFERTFKLAAGMQELRELITDEMMRNVMQLMDTPLGFRTDHDPKLTDRDGKPFEPYPVAVVKEALIEATLRGLQPVGNQFNIIGQRCYITKEGFTHKLKELPGFAGLQITMSPPRVGADGAGAIVQCVATWTMDGRPGRIECEIPVRINKGMGADAALGKAERKLKARIYAQITGSEQPEGDVEDVDNLRRVNEGKAAAGVDGLKERLREQQPEAGTNGQGKEAAQPTSAREPGKTATPAATKPTSQPKQPAAGETGELV